MPADTALAALLDSGGAYALSFVLGALFGSFANVCIYRLPPTDEHPSGRSVVSPGSHCFACGANVRWFDNIPLLSFLWLRGRCRDCKAPFSARYLLVELVTAVLFVVAFHQAFHGPQATGDILLGLHRFGVTAAFVFTLVVITFIDLDHKLILNKVTYPAIPLFFLLGWSLPGASWKTGLVGIVVGYGLVRVISDGYYYATGREGLGYGDGKLLAVVGALYGWKAVVVSVFVGSLVGSVVSIAILSVTHGRRQRQDEASGAAGDEVEIAPKIRHVEVPFGPFLVVGALMYAFGLPWLASQVGAWTGLSL